MKILFPSVAYFPEVAGGIEMYIHQLALGLKDKGHTVKVLAPAFTDEMNRNYFHEGVEVIRYKAATPKNRLQYSGIEANESLVNFTAALKQEKADIIHFSQLTNSSGMSIAHIKAAKETGAKIVYTNHLSEFICQRGDYKYMGSEPCDGIVTTKKCTACLNVSKGRTKQLAQLVTTADSMVTGLVGKKSFKTQLRPFVFPGFFTRWHVERNRQLLATVDVFVSIAKWSNDLLAANGWSNEKCSYIQTGVINENVSIGDTDFNSPVTGKPLSIVFMGRIFPVKGLDLLINAVKSLPEEKVSLDIYGPADTGGYLPFYTSCLTAVKGNSNIHIHPPVPNENVIEILSKHDVVCLPSRGNEMAPLIIQEAFKARLPVIGSDLPAIKEWITDDKNGLVFSTGNEKDLLSKIMRLINEPGLVNRLKANIPSPRLFSSVINDYEKLYESLYSLN